MSDSGFIKKIQQLEQSQDFAFLRSEGLKQIEKLAHKLWTDYNIHDPGITILELFCYAITDLGYRTGYDIKDILTGNDHGNPANRSDFHTAKDILGCYPVTFEDLRKILIDIPGVRNAWIKKVTPVPVSDDKSKLIMKPSGLYDVFIERDAEEDQLIQSKLLTWEELCFQVRHKLAANRNLCEDLNEVKQVDNEQIALCAEIEAKPGSDLDELLAEIYYRAENYISPRVKFHTLAELRAKGRPVEDIFEGPVLQHGFIDNEDLRQIKRRCEIRASDIINLLMEKDLPDLVAVKSISLLSFSGETFLRLEPWVLPVTEGRYPRFAPDKSKIIFYKKGLPYYANRERAVDLLRKKRFKDGRAKLWEPDDIPVPLGEYKALAEYYPAQNELPVTYYVGKVRVPASDKPLRKAQSKQLKAYLLLFEQMLANYLAQLDNISNLFSWKQVPFQTYFTQPVTKIDDIIADISSIYIDLNGLEVALEKTIETDAEAAERRNRFLDHLLGRFCEDVDPYHLLMHSIYQNDALEAHKRAIDDKRMLLRDYPLASSQRASAYNYRHHPKKPKNLSGFQQRVYRLLGIPDIRVQNLAGHCFKIKQEKPGFYFELKEAGVVLFKSRYCKQKSSIEKLLDYALEVGGDLKNYHDGDLFPPCAIEILNELKEEKKEEIKQAYRIGTIQNSSDPEKIRGYFAQVYAAEGFHIVEHILLRQRDEGDPVLSKQINPTDECACPEVEDAYSFRASVFLPCWPMRFQNMAFRRFVEDTIRSEAPAHVFLKICWLSHKQMQEFEKAYDRWARQFAGLIWKIAKADAGTTLAYKKTLKDLIAVLESRVNVYPAARLHDCTQSSSDEPQVSLNNTTIGTL